jgi:hypothetical protein
MKTSNKRFRVANENKEDISILLIEKDFKELDPCISEFDEEAMIFIDTEKKTYYFLDEECLRSSSEIINHKFNSDIEPITIEEIKKWE